jgi:hypothetical protein
MPSGNIGPTKSDSFTDRPSIAVLEAFNNHKERDPEWRHRSPQRAIASVHIASMTSNDTPVQTATAGRLQRSHKPSCFTLIKFYTVEIASTLLFIGTAAAFVVHELKQLFPQ